MDAEIMDKLGVIPAWVEQEGISEQLKTVV